MQQQWTMNRLGSSFKWHINGGPVTRSNIFCYFANSGGAPCPAPARAPDSFASSRTSTLLREIIIKKKQQRPKTQRFI
jgi:hypothetical protein